MTTPASSATLVWVPVSPASTESAVDALLAVSHASGVLGHSTPLRGAKIKRDGGGAVVPVRVSPNDGAAQVALLTHLCTVCGYSGVQLTYLPRGLHTEYMECSYEDAAALFRLSEHVVGNAMPIPPVVLASLACGNSDDDEAWLPSMAVWFGTDLMQRLFGKSADQARVRATSRRLLRALLRKAR